ncbi:MFS transporter [Chloroflexi bacterium]|nr:MFS transporter [Chloroflexota bacterium]RZP14242.1 MAG: MFS transporter [Chloroflexota bacterium]
MNKEKFSIKSIIWSVYAPSFLLSMGQGILIPVLPIFARDTFGSGDLLVGFAVAARHFGTMGFDVPAGILINRFGLNRTMITGVILFGLSAVIAGFSGSFSILLFSRILAGASFALWSISRHAYIASVIPNESRGKALSLFGGLGRIATIIGPLLGGILAEFVSIRAPFFLQGGVAIVTLILILKTSVNYELTQRKTNDGYLGDFKNTFLDHKNAYLTAGVAAIALQFLRASREIVIPLWGDNIGLRKDEIGYITTLSFAVDSVMFPISGYVMDRFGRRYTGIPAFAILGFSLVLIGTINSPILFLTSYSTLICASILSGVGNGISSGLVLTMGSDLSPPDNKGGFLGIWRLISDAGGAAGPSVMGLIANSFSLAIASFSSGFIALIGIFFLRFLVKETLEKKPKKGD